MLFSNKTDIIEAGNDLKWKIDTEPKGSAKMFVINKHSSLYIIINQILPV